MAAHVQEEQSDTVPLTVAGPDAEEISIVPSAEDEAAAAAALAAPPSRHDAPIEDEDREVGEWAELASAVLIAVILALLLQIIYTANQQEPAAPTCKPCFPPPSYTVLLKQSSLVLLRNGTLWLGDRYLQGDLLMGNGRIISIGLQISPPPGAYVLDLAGSVVTPGLIDSHSHVGALSYPTDLIATRGDNEYSDPVWPQMRIEDSFDGNDLALADMLSWGVTSFHVLPGSKEVIGGETFVGRVRSGAGIDEIRIVGAKEGMKFALGQNPKALFGPQHITPRTRMGEAWLIRQNFEHATQLKRKQDEWCEAGCRGPAPQDASIQPLVDILRGQRLFHVHVYQTGDFEMIIRIAKEFGFSIGGFHHATDAWFHPDLMLASNATVCIFVDTRWYRWETRRGSAMGFKSLIEAGVPVAVMSDHDAHLYVIHESQLLWHIGVSEHKALAALTSVLAAMLGLENRLGKLQEGMEADVVVWDRHPLRVGARPVHVFQEGERTFRASVRNEGPGALPKIKGVLQRNSARVTASGSYDSSYYAISAATVWTMSSPTPLYDATIIVRNGTVECVGQEWECGLSSNITDRFVLYPEDPAYTDTQATILPGIIIVGSTLGQTVMTLQGPDSDGVATPSSEWLRASDGISPGRELVETVFLSGATVSVNAPLGNNLVTGLSVAWRTYGTVLDDALIQDEVALHVKIGAAAKLNSQSSSISGQISSLRKHFINARAKNDSTEPLLRVLRGTLLLVAHVQDADQIAGMLRLQKEFGFRMTIYGGSEAYLLAPELAEAKVAVILSPVACSPWQHWTDKRCRLDSASILHEFGVKVGLNPSPESAVWSSLSPTRWIAGLAHRNFLPYPTALAGLTSSIADALHLGPTGIGRIAVGYPANFVLYNADPLEVGSLPMLIALGQHLEVLPPLP